MRASQSRINQTDMYSEHQIQYIAATKHFLPHWTDRQCELAMLTHFTCAKELEAAHNELGEKLYTEFYLKARNEIGLYNAWIVIRSYTGEYVYTAFSMTTPQNACRRARDMLPSLEKVELTARRKGLVEMDPYYVDGKLGVLKEIKYAL